MVEEAARRAGYKEDCLHLYTRGNQDDWILANRLASMISSYQALLKAIQHPAMHAQFDSQLLINRPSRYIISRIINSKPLELQIGHYQPKIWKRGKWPDWNYRPVDWIDRSAENFLLIHNRNGGMSAHNVGLANVANLKIQASLSWIMICLNFEFANF